VPRRPKTIPRRALDLGIKVRCEIFGSESRGTVDHELAARLTKAPLPEGEEITVI